eukprot:6179891-Pleurochrysis_carterae.AAC.1
MALKASAHKHERLLRTCRCIARYLLAAWTGFPKASSLHDVKPLCFLIAIRLVRQGERIAPKVFKCAE